MQPVHGLEVWSMLAGGLAGFLGALVGVGGGVLLIPILNGLLGQAFSIARGISLVGVLGTSGSAAMVPPGRRLVNSRLASFLVFFSIVGALVGTRFVHTFSDRTCEVLFGLTAAASAALMLARANTRNILPADTAGLGLFGGLMHDPETGTDVAYRVRRLPVASSVAFMAGGLASLIGVGGGIVIVPALNTLCGVPMRVAAATSVLIVGLTAIPGATASWAAGHLGDFHVAGMTCLGCMLGFQAGRWVSPQAPVRWLKTGMSVLLFLVSVQYLFLRS
jgi:uncharacterized membrane protein YfcA